MGAPTRPGYSKGVEALQNFGSASASQSELPPRGGLEYAERGRIAALPAGLAVHRGLGNVEAGEADSGELLAGHAAQPLIAARRRTAFADALDDVPNEADQPDAACRKADGAGNGGGRHDAKLLANRSSAIHLRGKDSV